MPAANSSTTYGFVSKSFHWLTAMLILSIIPIGIIATNLAFQIQSPEVATTDQTVYWATLLFTAHKTLGVAAFFTALARILWAITQTKPGLLNGDRKVESWAAETVHWLLYGSLVIVPLSGWIHHAATTGFAPIWWPFGQDLPFVPKSTALAELSGTLHYIFQWVLVASISLHVVGALKHHVVDKDATLRRMLPGHTQTCPTATQPGHALPLLTAMFVWCVALGAGAGLGWFSHSHSHPNTPTAELDSVESEWQIQNGVLQITITQLGSDVSGSFSDWTAGIRFNEIADSNGKHGDVSVTVSIASLSLGSVTGQAMGTDFFDEKTFPTAKYTADIVSIDDVLSARGSLTIRDQSVPVNIPFTLEIDGNIAKAKGVLDLDRRDFQIGQSVADEGSLGFSVTVEFDLTAHRH